MITFDRYVLPARLPTIEYEYRVDYRNLKTVKALNTLSEEELRSLWIPYIIFQNTDNDVAVELDGIRSRVFIIREAVIDHKRLS